MSKIDFRFMRGFTLIEVLISMIIMAIGLLGLAMLQGRALKTNKDAYLYGQASLLAYEMSDRIKANPAFWKSTQTSAGTPCSSGTPVNTLCPVPTSAEIAIAKADDTNGTPACSGNASASVSCTPLEMAAYDMYYWQKNAADQLPGVTQADASSPTNVPTIVRVTSTNATAACPFNVSTPSFCLTLTWTRTDNKIAGLTLASQQLGVTP